MSSPVTSVMACPGNHHCLIRSYNLHGREDLLSIYVTRFDIYKIDQLQEKISTREQPR